MKRDEQTPKTMYCERCDEHVKYEHYFEYHTHDFGY